MASSAFMGLMSAVRWRDRQLVFYFRYCGLQQRILQVDAQTSIACWCEPAVETQRPQKPALLLIHGFGASSMWQWEKQVKPLHRHFRLFLPDIVFFGNSSTVSHERSETFQAEKIALAMEALGVHSYNVLGISYGGFIAYRLAHIFPERVEKVAIVSSGICITPKDVQEMLARAHVDCVSDLFLPQSPAVLRTLMQLSFIKPFPLPSFLLNDVIQNLYVANRHERKELLDSLETARQHGEPIPIIPQKVLIIWGDQDGVFPLKLAHHLKEHLKEKAELAVIKDASHAVQLEKPVEFTKLVQRFFLQDGNLGEQCNGHSGNRIHDSDANSTRHFEA